MELIKETAIFILVINLLLLQRVLGHCSEAHRQTCSYPYLQLKTLSASSMTSSSASYVPDYNETTLRLVCKLFEEYENCSAPFLLSCNKQTQSELRTYEITLGLICHELLNDYIANRNCYQRLTSSFEKCKDKQLAAVHAVNRTQPSYKFKLCSSSKDYALCIYTVTALGCSMSAANVYFKLINHTLGSLFQINNYQCVLVHPLDEISIYTTSSSTSSVSQTTPSNLNSVGYSPKQYIEVSQSCSLHVDVLILISVLVVILLLFVIDET